MKNLKNINPQIDVYKYHVCLLILLAFLSCNQKQELNPENKDQLTENAESSGAKVTIQMIQDVDFQRQLISNGKISAIEKSELRFNITESIAQVNVVNGEKVKEGDVLATLENELLKNQLQKAEIDVSTAENKLQQEKINYGVRKGQKVSAKVLKSLQIKSGYLEAKNALENARIRYDQTLIKAPFSGVVANIEKKVGDYITPSDALCTLINPENLEVEFSILESELSFVSLNQKISITPFSNADKSYDGIISEINPLVDKNGLIKIRAKVATKSADLFDGMNTKVFVNKSLKDVIVIPKQGLVLRSNKEVVFTYNKGFAEWKYVTVVGENSANYAIKKGENLKETDTLIVSGNLNLAHDAKVTISK